MTTFDTLLGPGVKCRSAEDIDFVYRLYKNKLKMLYSPEVLIFHNHGRSNTQAVADALHREYSIGRGAFYCKHILQLDFGVLKMACIEVFSLSKTLLKGAITGLTFQYHKVAFPSLFLGALYYLKERLAENKPRN